MSAPDWPPNWDRIGDLVLVTGKRPPDRRGWFEQGQCHGVLRAPFARPQIHAFEPIPDLAERLTRRFRRHPSVVIRQCALGDCEAKFDLHITNNVVSSSLFRPSAVNMGVHGSAVSISRTVSIRTVALDDQVVEQVDIIKLDLQGYELRAL